MATASTLAPSSALLSSPSSQNSPTSAATTANAPPATPNPTQSVSFPGLPKPASSPLVTNARSRSSQDGSGRLPSGETTPNLTSSTSSPSITQPSLTPPSSLLNAEPGHLLEGSQSSVQGSPGDKKKQSILRRLSMSSRRSLALLTPGSSVTERDRPPSSHSSSPQKSKRTLSITAPIQRFRLLSTGSRAHHLAEPDNQVVHLAATDEEHHRNAAKHALEKGMRSVARTVKKSLHQLERPRSLMAERSKPDEPRPSQRDSLPASEPPQTTARSPRLLAPPLAAAPTRSRSASASEPKRAPASDAESARSLSSSDHSHSGAEPVDQTPPRRRVSSRAKKLVKRRPQSSIEPGTSAARLAWRAEAEYGSLPLAATLLAAPSPPPPDSDTFLALIPGQTTATFPALSLVPPPGSTLIEPPLFTAASMAASIRVEPAHSRRVSPDSSIAPDANADKEADNGFMFIRSPPDDETQTSQPASLGPPTGASWTLLSSGSSRAESCDEAEGYERARVLVTDESADAFGPHNAAETKGDAITKDDGAEKVPSNPPAPASVGEAQAVVPGESRMADEQDARPNESRKRKVPTVIHQGGLDEHLRRRSDETLSWTSGVSRRHKQARGAEVAYARPGRRLAVAACMAAAGTGKGSKAGSGWEARRRARRGVIKAAAAGRARAATDGPGRGKREGARVEDEVWKNTLVSTVIGLVVVAVVMIGTNSFGNLNGKSIVGNWIKKISF